MWDTIKNLMSTSNLAAFRNVLSSIAGAAIFMGLISASGAQDLINKIMSATEALTLLLAAIGGIVVAVNALIAAHKASPEQQKISVAAQPNTMVVTTTPQSSDAAVATKVADMHEVAEVVAALAVAAITGPKVVSTPTVGDAK